MALSSDLLKKLQKFNKKISDRESDYGVAFYDRDAKIGALNSGSIVINKIIGIGGYPKGRITEIMGDYSTGKTTLALHAIVECQKEGKLAIFMDYEGTFDTNYAERLGVNTNNTHLLLPYPTTLESGYDYLKNLVEELPEVWNEVGLIVFDSIAAMRSKASLDRNVMEQERPGLHAAALTLFMPWLNMQTRKANIVTICLNQERTNLAKAMNAYAGGPDVTSTGGKALQFFNSVKIHLQNGKKEYENRSNKITGETEKGVAYNRIKVSIIKNKVAPPFEKGELVMRFGTGVDNRDSMLACALSANSTLITRNGPTTTYKSPLTGDEHKFIGKQKLIDFLESNSDEYAALEKWFANSESVVMSDMEIKDVDPFLKEDHIIEDEDDIIIT